MQAFLCGALQAEGYELHAVATGEAALAKMAATAPNLVILDLQLAGKPNVALIPGEGKPVLPDLKTLQPSPVSVETPKHKAMQGPPPGAAPPPQAAPSPPRAPDQPPETPPTQPQPPPQGDRE